MEKFSLDAIGREQLAKATASAAGRSAATVYGGHEHVLRQTLLALRAGAGLSEHESPGEATVIVLQGRVELAGPDTTWSGRQGDLIVIPDARHSLRAIEDAVVLLTVAKIR